MTPAAITVVSANRHERIRQFLRDLWDYRELFLTFIERDLKVRYKQTVLGVIWVVLQPLLMTVAFSLIFGKIARMPSDGLPYILFYLGAIVPWNTFAVSLGQSSLSLEANVGLISKVYFPRFVVPGAIVFGSFVDFFVGWIVLNIVAAIMGHWTWQLVAVTPLLMLIQGSMALGIGAALASLNAQYRDVKHAVGFLIQVMMLGTPIVYSLSAMPVRVQRWMSLNPMAGVVTTYRAILRGGPLDWEMLGIALVMSLVCFGAGLWFFRIRESRLADIL